MIKVTPKYLIQKMQDYKIGELYLKEMKEFMMFYACKKFNGMLSMDEQEYGQSMHVMEFKFRGSRDALAFFGFMKIRLDDFKYKRAHYFRSKLFAHDLVLDLKGTSVSRRTVTLMVYPKVVHFENRTARIDLSKQMTSNLQSVIDNARNQIQLALHEIDLIQKDVSSLKE